MKKKVLIKMKLGIILTPDARSKAYLQKILKNQIVINEIIFMNDNHSEKTYSEEEENESTNSGFDFPNQLSLHYKIQKPNTKCLILWISTIMN